MLTPVVLLTLAAAAAAAALAAALAAAAAAGAGSGRGLRAAEGHRARKFWEGDASEEEGRRKAIYSNSMTDPEGSISSAYKLAGVAIRILEEGDEKVRECISDAFFDDVFAHQVELKSWTGLLMYQLCETFFAAENIGLGHMEIIENK